MAKATCSLEGCDRPRRGWGYCATHYRRFMKAGDPGPAEIRRWVRRHQSAPWQAATGHLSLAACAPRTVLGGAKKVMQVRLRSFGEFVEPAQCRAAASRIALVATATATTSAY